MKLNFYSDYVEGAHSRILDAIVSTNAVKTTGYGIDPYCDNAKALICKEVGDPDAKVHFLVGGTQANLTVLSAILSPTQGVLSADSGHIATHEVGAIEATGHKVIVLPACQGKLSPEAAEEYFSSYYADPTRDFAVAPGAVYISQPTEYGTLYTKEELTLISSITHKFGAKLFIDGARLGYALASVENDLSLADIYSLSDAFYIGGTKCGALFGEAVVMKPSLCPSFFSYMKQRGALLAKGRLLGLQFGVLFTDGLYTEICKGAVQKALRIKNTLLDKGYSFLMDSPTNQQFPIVDEAKLAELEDKVIFTVWERLPNRMTAIRLVTSFMTTDGQVDDLLKLF